MGYKSTRVYTYVLQTSSRKKIAKLLSRGASLASISMECFRDEAARHIIIKRTVGHYIKKELAAMCSDTVNSILLQSSSNDISSFTWEKLMDELAFNAPTLLYLLQCCTTTKSKKSADAIIGMCVALLCRHRRDRASLIQKIISLILYSGHTSKQVCCFTCACTCTTTILFFFLRFLTDCISCQFA